VTFFVCVTVSLGRPNISVTQTLERTVTFFVCVTVSLGRPNISATQTW